jgi:hypothetical protein
MLDDAAEVDLVQRIHHRYAYRMRDLSEFMKMLQSLFRIQVPREADH